MKKHVLFILGMCYALTFGQELPKIIPSNPEVAAMGKYGDIPVGNHTGVPSISIPLVQLSSGGKNFPVSLNYHASGFRVSEMASRVGLGWNINTGGAISRSVRGVPDDSGGGFLNPIISVSEFLAGTHTDRLAWIEQYHDSNDLESDIYNFNFLGESGKFFFTQDGQIIIHPKSDIKIEYFKTGTKIQQWVITATDGTKYYFGVSKDGLRNARDTSTTSSTNGSSLPDTSPAMEDYVSSWKLMDVETIDHNITSYSYDATTVSFWNVTAQQKEIPTAFGTSPNPVRTFYTVNNDKVHRISSISNDSGTILFDYDHARVDLKNDYALTKVSLKDNNNRVIDAYELSYDYFTSTAHANPSTIGDTDQRTKRLYLKSVTQTINNITNKSHTFTYNTSRILPDRFSYSQDFWGYYNGQANTLLYPQIEWHNNISNTYITIPGGNRKVYEEYAKACVLTKIQYPTGGTTVFDFESNKIANVGFFGLTEMEEESIGQISSINSTETYFEKDINIADPSIYVGGITWDVNMEPCANPSGLDCPKAELYKHNGTQYELIAATNGNGVNQHIRFDGDYPLNLKIKLYNNSGAFPPEPRKDISAIVYGKKLLPNAENAINAGGLRVKTIQTFDNDVEITRKDYVYTMFDDPTQSSGAALNPPTFLHKNMLFCDENANEGRSMDLLKSNSIFPLTNGGSYSVSYKNVTELLNQGNDGKIEYIFGFVFDGEGEQSNIYYYSAGLHNTNTPLQDFSHRRGLLFNKKSYAKTSTGYNLIHEVENRYNLFGEHILDENIVVEYKGCFGGFSPYKNLGERFYQTEQIIHDYQENGTLQTSEKFIYEPGGYAGRAFPIETTKEDSKGNTITTKTYYPDDVISTTSLGEALTNAELTTIQRLQKGGIEMRIGQPIQTETSYNGQKTTQRTNFKTWYNQFTLQASIEVAKGSGALENRVEYHDYDEQGNPLEASKTDGSHIIYIWGYDNTLPIAKIDNATYTGMPTEVTNLINQIKTTSNSEDTVAEEQTLRGLLEDLRAHNHFAGSMVTTYTYDPLVGITSMTDPRGYTTTYHYDDFNRLQYVKDHQGHLLSENKYNYKTQ